MKKITASILCTIVATHLCLGQLTTEPLVFGEQFELYSKLNDTNYKISVRLPDDYSTDSVDYPCLYLFYGEDKKFFVASGIAASLFEATWQTPKMIIVGVTNMDWWRDLTPVPIAGREGTGGADKFHSFVVQDLFKTVDTNYRTSDQRIFMGHSFGGLFGVYSFIDNSDYFDDFLLISPSIAERADYISDAFKKKIFANENLRNKFYISFWFK